MTAIDPASMEVAPIIPAKSPLSAEVEAEIHKAGYPEARYYGAINEFGVQTGVAIKYGDLRHGARWKPELKVTAPEIASLFIKWIQRLLMEKARNEGSRPYEL